jgi:hypothetical protein
MRYSFFGLILAALLNTGAHGQDKVNLPSSYKGAVTKALENYYSPSPGQLSDLLKGEVIGSGKVTTPRDKEQELKLFISGLHPRNCQRAMRKLSLYENYSTYVGFIKESRYNEQNQKINFLMDHALLPFPMSLSFKLPRITKEGVYPFVLEHGFLKDLKGTIVVKEVSNFCLLSMKTDWNGPETRIPNLIFESFIQTVGKIGLEHLIRVSMF